MKCSSLKNNFPLGNIFFGFFLNKRSKVKGNRNWKKLYVLTFSSVDLSEQPKRWQSLTWVELRCWTLVNPATPSWRSTTVGRTEWRTIFRCPFGVCEIWNRARKWMCCNTIWSQLLSKWTYFLLLNFLFLKKSNWNNFKTNKWNKSSLERSLLT